MKRKRINANVNMTFIARLDTDSVNSKWTNGPTWPWGCLLLIQFLHHRGIGLTIVKFCELYCLFKIFCIKEDSFFLF